MPAAPTPLLHHHFHHHHHHHHHLLLLLLSPFLFLSLSHHSSGPAAAAAAAEAAAAAATAATPPLSPPARHRRSVGNINPLATDPLSAASVANGPLPGDRRSQCHGGSCGGMADYPVNPATVYYSVFDVPQKPREADGICFYIYFNIFFSGKGHGGMNQFVPQLMLGNSLTNSSGPPDYKPQWIQHDDWVFGSQYFFEINNTETNNTHEGHAATGPWFPARQGEKLWTKFSLSDGRDGSPGTADKPVWTLGMGVVGDESRTSTVVTDTPFMGLAAEDTQSWAEPEYSKCHVNTCWELYGVTDRYHFPSSGSRYDIDIITDAAHPISWMTHWNPELENGGCANTSILETHNETQQHVVWIVDDPPE